MLTSDQIVAAVLKKKPFFDKRGEVTIVKRSPRRKEAPLANIGTGISVKQEEALLIESMESSSSSSEVDKEDLYLWNYGKYYPKQKSRIKHVQCPSSPSLIKKPAPSPSPAKSKRKAIVLTKASRPQASEDFVSIAKLG